MIMAKKMAFGGVKKMRGGGTSSRGSASSSSASKPSSSSKPATSYINMRDRFDGGGKGTSGPTFSGGPFSGMANAIGIKPMAARADKPSGGGGGADSGQAAAREQAQLEAYKAVRDYKGNPDNSGGKGPSAAPAAAEAAAEATMVPKKVMKRTYMGPPPKGYDAGKQGEYTYFKSEMVDAPAKPMKKGGKVRGCGCAQRGMRAAKMV
jgi:hypothetical protein